MNTPAKNPFLASCADAIRRAGGHKFPPLGAAAYRAFFRWAPRRLHTELLPGVQATLDLTEGTQQATYWLGDRFEAPTPAVLRGWTAPAGSVFFDIGSNYGWFSLFLSVAHPGLTVHAFEPNPETFARLDHIAEENGLRGIRRWRLALGEAAGEAELHPGIEDSGHSTLGDHPDLKSTGGFRVQVQPFDAWREEAGLALPPDPSWVAKIDVEGFELRVLRGMAGALRARAFRGLAIEFLESTLAFCDTSPDELIAFLAEVGYREQDFGADPARTANRFFVPAAR